MPLLPRSRQRHRITPPEIESRQSNHATGNVHQTSKLRSLKHSPNRSSNPKSLVTRNQVFVIRDHANRLSLSRQEPPNHVNRIFYSEKLY